MYIIDYGTTWIINQQLRGYKVEAKLRLELREQKKFKYLWSRILRRIVRWQSIDVSALVATCFTLVSCLDLHHWRWWWPIPPKCILTFIGPYQKTNIYATLARTLVGFSCNTGWLSEQWGVSSSNATLLLYLFAYNFVQFFDPLKRYITLPYVALPPASVYCVSSRYLPSAGNPSAVVFAICSRFFDLTIHGYQFVFSTSRCL
jgi:hypothetical protein